MIPPSLDPMISWSDEASDTALLNPATDTIRNWWTFCYRSRGTSLSVCHPTLSGSSRKVAGGPDLYGRTFDGRGTSGRIEVEDSGPSW